jgi:hypothetical protein
VVLPRRPAQRAASPARARAGCPGWAAFASWRGARTVAQPAPTDGGAKKEQGCKRQTGQTGQRVGHGVLLRWPPAACRLPPAVYRLQLGGGPRAAYSLAAVPVSPPRKSWMWRDAICVAIAAAAGMPRSRPASAVAPPPPPHHTIVHSTIQRDSFDRLHKQALGHALHPTMHLAWRQRGRAHPRASAAGSMAGCSGAPSAAAG